MLPTHAIIGLASLSLLVTQPVQAAPCWKAETIGAARLRELDVMLMTVMLRCENKGFKLRETFDRFSVANKRAIQTADGALKAHYGADKNKAGKVEYDQYLTGLANHYGSGYTDVKTCETFQTVMNELAKAPEESDMMASVSIAMVRDPRLDAGRCAASNSNSSR